MADKHLSNEEFFTRLQTLFDSHRTRSRGSVYLTQKRLVYNQLSTDVEISEGTKTADDPLWDLHPPHPLPVIIRATDGKGKDDRSNKIKISTVVQPDSLEGFYVRYAEICKGGMDRLKKRDRSKKRKERKKKAKGGAAAAQG